MTRPNDRVTDGVAAFYARLRAGSPRRRRLQAQHELRMARIDEAQSMICGGLLFLIILILFSFL